jgi:REP element-mobilizing transposase RayT
MGQSLVKNYLHITFSTKHRVPLIDFSIESGLHSFIGTICKNLDSSPIKVGGYLDHIHIVCNLSKKTTLIELLRVIKANSSRWMKTNGDAFRNFGWQDGYAAFSVSPSEIDAVVRYVEMQREHHQQTSFQDELRLFLKQHKMDFDERYIWE